MCQCKCKCDNSMFPIAGDFFSVKKKNSSDGSFSNSIFECVASDSVAVVAKEVGFNTSYKHTFIRSVWNITPVSRCVANAARN